MDAPQEVSARLSVVLKVLSGHEPNGATTTEVAHQSRLARATAHRLLSQLAAEGLVERHHDTHRWLLGPELFLLGRTAAPRYDVTAAAGPIVQQLSEQTQESAFFSARRAHQTVCLVQEDGSFPVRSHVLHEGIRFPLGIASAGLAILAYLSDPEIDEYLRTADLAARYGPPHSEVMVRDRIAQTRANGWALNAGHIVEGSWGMAAAVFDPHGQPGWAFTITGIQSRFDGPRRQEYGRHLLDAAHRLTRVIASQQGGIVPRQSE